MLFNIVLLNHGSKVAFSTLSPITSYLRQTLSLCGHEVILSWDEIICGCVNLFLEYFPADEQTDWAEGFRSLRREHNAYIGVVATELMINGVIPYAMNGIGYFNNSDEAVNRKAKLDARMNGFHSAIAAADFVWCFLERTALEYKEQTAICEFFPVGCLELVPPELRRAPKDIDVLFFGKATPHRVSILQAMEKAGVSVYIVGQGWERGSCDPDLLESLIDRAKICLNLSLTSTEDTEPGLDPRFASCMRVAEILSRGTLLVSETIPLDNPYAPYMFQADPQNLPELCKSILADGRWINASQMHSRDFLNNMSAAAVCKPVVDMTLSRLPNL